MTPAPLDFDAIGRKRLPTLLTAMPKAELHLHIEGTLEPELAVRLAQKHRIMLPSATAAGLRRAYRFSDLQSFLEVYYACSDVLRDEEDFHALTLAYLGKAHEQGIVHAEIFFDPQAHMARGVPYAAVVGGIRRALAHGNAEWGISSRLILCFLRHLTAREAMDTLEQALRFEGSIDAVGLDSAERGHPPSKFTAVFERARRAGLAAVAHAGEEGPPAYIREALDLLQVARIDHGVRCEEDPELVRRLAHARTPLTVCPLSNVVLKVFPAIEAHNLKRLLDRGLCVTVNSDDPAYFGGYLLENLLAVQQGLDLSRADLAQLARNSFEASFLAPAAKRGWLAAVEAYVSGSTSQ
jgi:adenosine deaminase